MNYLALKIGGKEINGPVGIPTGETTSLDKILQTGISLLYLIAIVLALLYLFWGGLDWLRSEGDKNKVESAKKRVLYAIIGLCVVFFSYLILSFFGEMFGAKDLV